MDQEAYARNNEQEERRKCIDLECKRDVQVAGTDKIEQGDNDGAMKRRTLYLKEDPKGNNE